MKIKIAYFLIPILAVLIPLYQAITNLQITVARSETLAVIGTLIVGALAVGLLGAFGGDKVRLMVLVLTTLFIIDVAVGARDLFEGLAPRTREIYSKDASRVADLRQIREALETYLLEVGPLPMPSQYGESNLSPAFWNRFWDVSTSDADGDGTPFLDFLVDSGIVSTVPIDPDNQPANDNRGPTTGKRYVYFLTPAAYKFQGGSCMASEGLPVYMLAVTDLESETTRLRRIFSDSGCDCLWQNQPGFFESHFDYVLCGAAAPTIQGAQLAGAGVVRIESSLDGDFFLKRLVVEKTTESSPRDGEIQLMSRQEGTLLTFSPRSFLGTGTLTISHSGRVVLSGAVDGGEGVLAHFETDVNAGPGYLGAATLSEEGSFQAAIEFPGTITDASFEVDFKNYRNREAVDIALEVLEAGQPPATPVTKTVPYDAGTVRWDWKPTGDTSRLVQVRVHFPYADAYIGLTGFRFRLEGNQAGPGWRPGDTTLTLRNSSPTSFDVQWIGASRL